MRDNKLKISPESIAAAIGSTIGAYIAHKTKMEFWEGQGVGLIGGIVGFGIAAAFTSFKK